MWEVRDMTLTTLIGLLAISAAPKQEPVQVTIETKVCKVVGKYLTFEEVKMDIMSLTEEAANPNIVILRNFDEAKLLKNKGLKILSAPVIRTLDSMKAELTVSVTRDAIETWKTTYVPVVRKDALLDLDIKLAVEVKDDSTKGWNVSAKPKLHPGQPVAYIISKDNQMMLYVIKAHIGNGS